MTDVLEGPLVLARRIGAEAAINVAANADALEADARSVDGYEVTFEVSGNPAGLATCLEWVRPGAIVVQWSRWPPGKVPVAGNAITANEIALRGARRFDREFEHAETPAPAHPLTGARPSLSLRSRTTARPPRPGTPPRPKAPHSTSAGTSVRSAA
jgi:hypothetical protein